MFLLDTCVLLWLGTDQSKIPAQILTQLRDPAVPLFISAISALEIGTKHAKGKLTLPLDPETWISVAIASHSLTPIPISWEIAVRSSVLAKVHSDPADRIIVATAAERNLTVITPDPMIHAYPGIRILW